MNAIATEARYTLNEIDWVIVDIARRDGPGSLSPKHSIMRRVRDFFGVPVARPFANEQLEALRRFCIRAWHRDLIRTSDVRPLINAGYSMIDAVQILAHVARYRGFTPSLQEGAI